MPSVSPVPTPLPESRCGGGESCSPQEEERCAEGNEEEGDEAFHFCLELSETATPPAVREWAQRHLGETPTVRASALRALREAVYARQGAEDDEDGEGAVAPHRLDDAFLLRFLRARAFNVDKAYRLLRRYYSFKDEHPQMHRNVNLDSLRALGEDDVISVTPYRDLSGRRILIYKIGNWSPSKHSVDELFRASLAILELAILEPRTQLLGGYCVFDLGGLSLQHAWQVTPGVAHTVLQLMGGSFPIRTSAIHIVNQSWIFDAVFAIFKPLIDDKMREKIHFHGSDLESLHRHIEPKCLPEQYGGTRPDWDYNHWLDSLRNDEAVMREMRSLGYRTDDDPPPEEEDYDSE